MRPSSIPAGVITGVEALRNQIEARGIPLYVRGGRVRWSGRLTTVELTAVMKHELELRELIERQNAATAGQATRLTPASVRKL